MLRDDVRSLLLEGAGVVEIKERLRALGQVPDEFVFDVRRELIAEGHRICSPYGLVQERVRRDDGLYPWRVIVLCCLMNQTHARQVRPILLPLFELWPEPSAMAVAGPHLEDLIRPLGFRNRRANALRRMSAEYADGVPPNRCYGVGDYAKDAIEVFCHDRTDVQPNDGFLAKYVQWRKEVQMGRIS